MMTAFDLEHIHLGSLTLHLKKFLYGPTYPPNFVLLTFTGAEIAGGGQILPIPLQGPVSPSEYVRRTYVRKYAVKL